MNVWLILLCVAFAGALGGVVACLTSEDAGFVLPQRVEGADKTIFRPGWIGLVIVGAVAAALSFALYGSIADFFALGGPEPASGTDRDEFGITFGALAGALLVGAGGSKWLATQVDAKILQQAAAAAAAGPTDAGRALKIASARPTEALRLARGLTA